MRLLAPVLPWVAMLAVLVGLWGAHKIQVALAHHAGVVEGRAELQPQLDQLNNALTDARRANGDLAKALKAKDDQYAEQAKAVRELAANDATLQAQVKEALAKVAAEATFYTSEVARLGAIAHSPAPMNEDDCAQVDALLRSVERQRLRH